MRLLQNTLLLFGGTALGAVAGGMAMHLMLRVLFPVPKVENYGGELYWLGGICCSGVLAGCAGFAVALNWIRQSQETRWGPAIWGGVVLGLVAGVALGWVVFARVTAPLSGIGLAFLTAAGGTVGGIAAATVARNRKGRSSAKARLRRRNSKRR